MESIYRWTNMHELQIQSKTDIWAQQHKEMKIKEINKMVQSPQRLVCLILFAIFFNLSYLLRFKSRLENKLVKIIHNWCSWNLIGPRINNGKPTNDHKYAYRVSLCEKIFCDWKEKVNAIGHPNVEGANKYNQTIINNIL